jgi:hypothetical protein
VATGPEKAAPGAGGATPPACPLQPMVYGCDAAGWTGSARAALRRTRGRRMMAAGLGLVLDRTLAARLHWTAAARVVGDHEGAAAWCVFIYLLRAYGTM